jgi:hypothetical protein
VDADYNRAIRHAKQRRDKAIQQAKDRRGKRLATLDIRMAELISAVDNVASVQNASDGTGTKLRLTATSGSTTVTDQDYLSNDRRTSM